MSWNLFIDDERFPASDGREWFIARDAVEALSAIFLYGMPSYISFDHDLGKDQTGYDIAKKLVEYDMDGKHEFPEDFAFYVHSQNPIGRKNIETYLNNYLKVKHDGML